MKDKVTNIRSYAITYDKSGNPLSYRDDITFTWQKGRQLASLQISDNIISYKYDSNGMRTQKTDNSGTTYYYYDSKNNLIGMTKGNDTLLFYYDTDGNVTSFKYGDTMYYYVKNLQGDVVKIINQSGTVYASYVYDAWGNIKSITGDPILRELNPFRYRGYVYDNETGLYYLKSRYYDPETGRFINADIYCDTNSSIFGTNMFTYCNNNPVNQIDPEGTDAYWLQFSNAVNSIGHTSLLLKDSVNNWWYFYWGPKQAILRPCGKDDFSMSELNSYLTGFDPRPHHNYYVYATNVFNDSEDVGYGSRDNKYFVKCHDGTITNWLYFRGNFATSFNYARELLTKLYSWSNANQLYETVYENGKKIDIYNVCEKIYYPYAGSAHRYYYKDLKSRNEAVIRSYNFLSYNCVQVSMEVLLKGRFSGEYKKYSDRIYEIYGNTVKGDMLPNNVYDKLKGV